MRRTEAISEWVDDRKRHPRRVGALRRAPHSAQRPDTFRPPSRSDDAQRPHRRPRPARRRLRAHGMRPMSGGAQRPGYRRSRPMRGAIETMANRLMCSASSGHDSKARCLGQKKSPWMPDADEQTLASARKTSTLDSRQRALARYLRSMRGAHVVGPVHRQGRNQRLEPVHRRGAKPEHGLAER